eukprot:jgi/Phyca11/510099/fgenesh2_kg.PHYCAscaffold_53_\
MSRNDVIDLQDESEEEEKNDNGRKSQGLNTSTAENAGDNQASDKNVDDTVEPAHTEAEPEEEEDNQVSADELPEPPAPDSSSPAQPLREPWEGIDGSSTEQKQPPSTPQSPVFN